jgi:hypothetical protein
LRPALPGVASDARATLPLQGVDNPESVNASAFSEVYGVLLGLVQELDDDFAQEFVLRLSWHAS